VSGKLQPETLTGLSQNSKGLDNQMDLEDHPRKDKGKGKKTDSTPDILVSIISQSYPNLDDQNGTWMLTITTNPSMKSMMMTLKKKNIMKLKKIVRKKTLITPIPNQEE